MSAGPLTYIAHSGSVATTASTQKFILGLNAIATQDISIAELMVSADVITVQTPMLVELYRITALGTSSAGIAVKWGSQAERAANVLPRITYTVNPTLGDLVWTHWLSPYSPTFPYSWPKDDYPFCSAGAAVGFVLAVTPAAASTPNVRASLRWLE